MNEDDLKYFKSILTETGVLHGDPSSLEAYNTDWMRKFKGSSTTVLRPKTTEQVSQILKYCNQRRYNSFKVFLVAILFKKGSSLC